MDSLDCDVPESTLGELWNILPYAGPSYVSATCGKVTQFETPLKKSTYLAGIPFAGDNSGANSNLRLLTFVADSLDGPIKSTNPEGVQMLFFDSQLIYRIAWRIKPISPITGLVQIGFYTANYIPTSFGDNTLIPLLTTKGPAFFPPDFSPDLSKQKCGKKGECGSLQGSFVTTQFDNMYVIVDANVSVELKITFKKPDFVVYPCFKVLWKRHKYVVDGEVVATEQLVSSQDLLKVLRPTDDYVPLSNQMISYLGSRSVAVVIFNTPSLAMSAKMLKPPPKRIIEIPKSSLTVFERQNSNNPPRAPSYSAIFHQIELPGGARTFAFDQGTATTIEAKVSIVFANVPVLPEGTTSYFEFWFAYEDPGGTQFWRPGQQRIPIGPTANITATNQISQPNITIRIGEYRLAPYDILKIPPSTLLQAGFVITLT